MQSEERDGEVASLSSQRNIINMSPTAPRTSIQYCVDNGNFLTRLSKTNDRVQSRRRKLINSREVRQAGRSVQGEYQVQSVFKALRCKSRVPLKDLTESK